WMSTVTDIVVRLQSELMAATAKGEKVTEGRLRSSVVFVGALVCCGPQSEVQRAPTAVPASSQAAPSGSEGKYQTPMPSAPVTPSRATGVLAVDHITLLEPQDLMAQRTDAQTLAALLEPSCRPSSRTIAGCPMSSMSSSRRAREP